MLTVQEIQALTFEKTMFNGYDPKSVDDVLEQITEDYAAMQKENAALKSKMKVLVDKIDEYRSVEDGMRRALVSAQGIAQETLDKAKAEAAQIIESAKADSEVRVKQLKAEIAAEEQRLEIAKKNNADFLSKMTAVYEAQMKILVKLSTAPELQPAEAQEQPAEQAEAPAQETAEEPQAAPDITRFAEQQKQASSKFNISEVTLASSETPKNATLTDTQRLHEQATARFDFGELKFGADYKPENEG